MGKFRLKANAGAHKHTDGRTYGPGEVIDSDQNLALIFREKFEALDSPQPVFVGPAGGRTGNERPEDHAGRDVWENDAEADAQAKANNANLQNDGVDTEKEDIAENVAANDEFAPETEASAGRPKRTQPRLSGTPAKTAPKTRSTR